MWPDQVSNLGTLAFKSDALPTAPCGPASIKMNMAFDDSCQFSTETNVVTSL